MATLPDMLHAEIQRCRRVAEDCASLGTSGAFASALIQQALRQAERALEARELPAIQQSIDRLRGWQDVMPDAPRRAVPAPVAPRRPGLGVAPQGRPLWAPTPREQFFTWKRAV